MLQPTELKKIAQIFYCTNLNMIMLEVEYH